MNLAGLLLLVFVVLPVAVIVAGFVIRVLMMIGLLACPPLRRWAAAKAEADI